MRSRWLLIAATGFLAWSAMSSVRSQAPETWRDIDIASEGARPPYNYLDQNNDLAGFEIDLGRELCTRMKARCRFLPQEWDQLIPNLLAGQYDAIMAAFEITDERREKIAFSDPYVKMPLAFAAARNRAIRAATPEALEGRTIGIEADGPYQSYLEANYPKLVIKSYAAIDEVMLDLAEGRIDVAFGDEDEVRDFLDHRPESKCCKFLAAIPRSTEFFGEGIGIGLRKTDGDLKLAFDKALADAVADGTFARIRGKYWNFEIR